jgi:hypothetical protein
MGVRSGSTSSSSSNTGLSPYSTLDSSAPARFNAGTGLGGTGLAKMSSPLGLSTSPSSMDTRPPPKRQETAPPGLGLNGDSASTNLSSAAARAAELVNGSHTISAGQSPRPTLGIQGNPNLQASRPAPPRPLLTANRPAPPTPRPDHTPSSADLRARQKAQGPLADPPVKTAPQPQPARKDTSNEQGRGQTQGLGQAQGQTQQSQGQGSGTRPGLGTPSKSSPATTAPATQPAAGPAGATVGPPPVKPLQPVKKAPAAVPAQNVTFAASSENGGGIAAAAAALEKSKDKDKEKRISTMTEVQIMEKLRTVVSDDDPKLLYSKIKKVGQG